MPARGGVGEGAADVRRYLRKSGSELYWGGTWGTTLKEIAWEATQWKSNKINRNISRRFILRKQEY